MLVLHLGSSVYRLGLSIFLLPSLEFFLSDFFSQWTFRGLFEIHNKCYVLLIILLALSKQELFGVFS